MLNANERKKYIKALEKEMLQAAKNLEFERAAVIRDEIELVKNGEFNT
jgi:excinuclease ABC subunit B